MAWTIELTETARKNLKKIAHEDAKRIRNFLRQRLEHLSSPRQLGKALAGRELGDFWCYRVGDYRIVCDLQDAKLCRPRHRNRTSS